MGSGAQDAEAHRDAACLNSGADIPDAAPLRNRRISKHRHRASDAEHTLKQKVHYA